MINLTETWIISSYQWLKKWKKGIQTPSLKWNDRGWNSEVSEYSMVERTRIIF